MGRQNRKEQLIEEIELYIRYAVPEEDIRAAINMTRTYRGNKTILRVLREFYSSLPEAREEAVVKVSCLVRQQDVNLLVVATAKHAYLYLVSGEDVLLAGEYLHEVNQEILSYFGFDSQENFLKICPPVQELDPCEFRLKERVACPVCNVLENEYHLTGCTVEVCPWCDGQLANCNCRFEQLDSDEIEDEEMLERFLELLDAKGRIPFRKGDAPAYPGTSGGLDKGSEPPDEY
jgi:hypothetical protein